MFPLQERRPRTVCAQSTAWERGLSAPGDSIDKGVPGRGGSRGEETVAGEGRALFSFDPGCGRGGRYNNPVLTREQNREVLPLAACPRLAENSRQGVPTSTQTLYWGFEFAISNTYMGLQFRCSETVSGPVDAPNNGTTKQQQCAVETLKKNGVSLALDAAGFIPGESQLAATVQLGVSAASFTNSLMTGSGNNAAIGATSSIVGAQITGVGMAAKSMGVSWAKAVPWIGYGVNALATLNDLSSAYGDYQSCMSHP